MILREIIEEKGHGNPQNKESGSSKHDVKKATVGNGGIVVPYSSIYDFKLYISNDICRKLEIDDFWFSEMLLNADIIYEGESSLSQLIDEVMSLHDTNQRLGVVGILSNGLLEIRVFMKEKKAGIIAYTKDAILSCMDVFDLIPEKIKGNVIIGIVMDIAG